MEKRAPEAASEKAVVALTTLADANPDSDTGHDRGTREVKDRDATPVTLPDLTGLDRLLSFISPNLSIKYSEE